MVGDGTRAYLSYWDLGTVVLDVSTPARPRYLGRTRGAVDNAHSAWLGRDGLLVETHETTGGTPTFYPAHCRRPGAARDVRAARAVIRAGPSRRAGSRRCRGSSSPTASTTRSCQGSLALFSWYGQGVVAADVSNPRTPRFLARFLARPEADPERLLCPGRRCIAVWGVDVEGETIVASDLIGGLWVLRLRRG